LPNPSKLLNWPIPERPLALDDQHAPLSRPDGILGFGEAGAITEFRGRSGCVRTVEVPPWVNRVVHLWTSAAGGLAGAHTLDGIRAYFFVDALFPNPAIQRRAYVFFFTRDPLSFA